MGTGPKRPPFPKFCHTYLAKMKLDKSIPYLKKAQKIYESLDKKQRPRTGNISFMTM